MQLRDCQLQSPFGLCTRLWHFSCPGRSIAARTFGPTWFGGLDARSRLHPRQADAVAFTFNAQTSAFLADWLAFIAAVPTSSAGPTPCEQSVNGGRNDHENDGKRTGVSDLPVLTRLMFPEAITAGHCGEIPLFAVRPLRVCWSGTVRLRSPKPHACLGRRRLTWQ